ncbi:MAG: VanZ family protein [Burkholderiales bacterium]
MRIAFFVVVMLLITYGSLYPFSFSFSEPQPLGTLLTDFRLFTSRGDVLGNCLLFVPFGVGGMFAFAPRIGTKPGAVAVAAAGFVFALSLQWAQLYLPSRDAVLSDVIWNGLGLALGIAAASFAKFHWDKSPPAIPLALLVLWFAQELVPFLPTLDWQKIKDSVKPLFLDPEIEVARALFHFAAALLTGRVLTEVVGERASMRWLLLFVLAVLAAKLFVVSRVLSWSLVLGMTLACAVWKCIGEAREPRRGAFIMLTLLAAIAATSLHPFTLRWPPGKFTWIPFAGQLEGAMLVNLSALIEKTFLYAGVLWLVGARNLWPSAICLVLVVLLLEAAQTLIAGRSADITEAVWILLTAAALRAAKQR